MKITHRVPPPAAGGDPVDAAYEAEVQQTLARAEARWRRAQHAAERLERRIERLEAQRGTAAITRELDNARMELLRRYDELRELEQLMQRPPGGSGENWSGRGSVRNPLPKGSQL
jgi:hypothetical protein